MSRAPVRAWWRACVWFEETWDRHVRYRELYRLLDRMRERERARTDPAAGGTPQP